MCADHHGRDYTNPDAVEKTSDVESEYFWQDDMHGVAGTLTVMA